MVEIIGTIEIQDQVAIHGGGIAGRIIGANTGRQTLDDSIRIRAMEIGDRVTVGLGVV